MKTANMFLKKHKALKSCWSDESRLTQACLIACLKKLEQLSGNKSEYEEANIVQQAGNQKFKCRSCKTSGFVEYWNKDDEKQIKKVIEDCKICKATGFVNVNVVDKRKQSKNFTLEYEDEY